MQLDPAQTQVLNNVQTFAKNIAKILKGVFEVEFSIKSATLLSQGIKEEKKFFASILYTGTSYGEYILAMSEETAANLLGASTLNKKDTDLASLRQEIQDTFSELLNGAVGESILSINDSHKKLTMTAPRVYFGQLSYPPIKTGKALLSCGIGEIECYFYIDHMRLDIASSYSGALESLEVVHKDLQVAMDKLKRQQSILVQSEKMAALGTMAAGVAHEINTPLSIVRLVGDQLKELVKNPSVDPVSLIRLLDKIDNTINRIVKVTNGMRVFAQSARNGSFARVSANEFIDDALLLSEPHIKAKGVAIKYTLPPAPLLSDCRVCEISQVLVNLITNSCNAIQTLSEKWIHIDVQDAGDKIEISVTDSGSGIPATILDKIFDPFFTTHDVGDGTGLGLSIAKGIMESHGGSIRVDSLSPRTKFVLLLPKAQTQQQAS